ncbi:serine-rich adhesin for platelets-like [Haliotis rubra]|uniref:serine-rich adhesin for platelets-like n=1 Tax=Haliotis rubra TaxID=36100 RepID=UPI001EE61D46|nr:serine-rich adhesin for platelets-like [Haliotis rubra]
MVSSSFTVKRNDMKILLLSLLSVIPSILAMSNSSVVVNGIVFTVQADNKTRPEARRICKSKTARLPLYMSTEIQSKVVQELGDHWIALKRNGSNTPWKWRIPSLTAEVPGRWKCYGDGFRAITDSQTHWMLVSSSSSHRVVCEGGSEEGATKSLNVNGTVFRFDGDNATFWRAKKLCKDKTARLPQYLSTVIQSKVVQKLGDHWIGLYKDRNVWKWQNTTLPANESNKWNDTGNGNRAITAGGRHWMKVRSNSRHRVVCEGGSRNGTTTDPPITDCNVTAIPSTAVTTTTATTTTTTTTAETTTTSTATDTTSTATDTTSAASETTSTATDTTSTATDTTSAASETTNTVTDTTSTVTDTTSTATDTTSTATDTTSTVTDTTSTATDTTSTATDTTGTATDTTSTVTETTETTSTAGETTATTTTVTDTTTTTTTAETATTSTATDTTFAETTAEPLGVDRMGRTIFKKCICRCRNLKAAPIKLKAVAVKVTELKKNVSVNLKDMTKSILKKTSRVDKRSSADVIGWAYLIVVAVPFMAVVFGDILKVVKWLCVKNKGKPIFSGTE